jgi:hypothetical protein
MNECRILSPRGVRVAALFLSSLAAALVIQPRAAPASAATVSLQAEEARIFHGAVERNHACFTGTGFVNSANEAGSYIEWTVNAAAAGYVPLRFRYANGNSTNRPVAITVNGITAGTLAFQTTRGWADWETQSLAASFRFGVNTVRATSTTSSGLPNIDSLIVDDGQGGDGPVADPIPEDPIPSGLGLTLTPYAAFPKSNPVPDPTDDRLRRWARINFLGEVPDGSGRRFVPDLNGRLYFLPAAGGTPLTYFDLRSRIGANFFSGRGLGSGFGFVAFHPDFASNGRFFTTHTEAFDALQSQLPDWSQSSAVVHSVVTEWTAANPAAATFSGTRRQLLRIGFASYAHAIQQIDFNPTAAPGSADYGLLYVAVGDGGTGYRNTGPQDLRRPHGKILRIDPGGRNSGNGRYGIPLSNPFVGQPNTLGEIYALGMRDPHRFSWDMGGSKRMFLGHIGEHDIEAVYDVRAGDNLGWSEREGPFLFNRLDRCNLYALPAYDAQFGYDYPVAAYDHNASPGWPCTRDVGRGIVGGFVYRGSALSSLRGKYVFGDLVDGRVFYTRAALMCRDAPPAPLYQLSIFAGGTRVTMQNLAGDSRVDMRFGTDRGGTVYVLSKANGRIWKVTGTRGSGP